MEPSLVTSDRASLATTRDTIGPLNQLLIETDALDRPLADKLAWLTARAREIAPDLMAAEDRIILRLIAGDTSRKSPRCGAPMPAFSLPDTTGTIVDLKSVLSTGPAIIVLNRGHWCPYDRLQLRDLVRALPLLGDGRVGVVSIVPETVALAARLAQDNGLPFKVLSDANLGYSLTLGLVTWAGDELTRCLEGLGLDLPRFRNFPSWLMPMPATFVVDVGGTIRSRFDVPDFRQRISPADIDTVLRGLPSLEHEPTPRPN